MQGSEDHDQEIGLLRRWVKTAGTLLTYLKSKARIMAVSHLAHTSCGIEHQAGVGFVDRNGKPLAEWSKDIDLSSFASSDEESSAVDINDGEYVGEFHKSVHLVTDVMESLVKRAMMAENEAAAEREKVDVGLEDIRTKTLQIESMSAKFEEIARLALGANGILNEMRQSLKDMVLETSMQRQRASENEQELYRVKQEFESLRSYVGALISVRDTLISSEKQFEALEKLFERLVVKTTHLESENTQEAEAQKLMAERSSLPHSWTRRRRSCSR